MGTIFQTEGGPKYESQKLATHPGYWTDGQTSFNDIGLIRTAKDIVFNQFVKPIQIRSTSIKEGETAIISGFGNMGAHLPQPMHLQYIKVRVISNAECKKSVFGDRITPVHFCTYKAVGVGVCNGDSGGPLTIDGKLVGVTSFGIPCGTGAPDVYARVEMFMGWLKENME